MPMTREHIDVFEKVIGQLGGLYDELSILSKKSPRDGLNLFKLRLVNQLMEHANTILGSQYRPFEEFDGFDEDDLPQNSDVVLMLSQYLQCMEKLKADNVNASMGRWEWDMERPGTGPNATLRTTPPKRLRE